MRRWSRPKRKRKYSLCRLGPAPNVAPFVVFRYRNTTIIDNTKKKRALYCKTPLAVLFMAPSTSCSSHVSHEPAVVSAGVQAQSGHHRRKIWRTCNIATNTGARSDGGRREAPHPAPGRGMAWRLAWERSVMTSRGEERGGGGPLSCFIVRGITFQGTVRLCWVRSVPCVGGLVSMCTIVFY